MVLCDSASIRIRIRFARCQQHAKRQKHKPCEIRVAISRCNSFTQGALGSGHLQNGKPARHKNPGKMGKKMENGARPFFAHSGPAAIFHFLSHFPGIFVSGRFPILYMATSIATLGRKTVSRRTFCGAESPAKRYGETCH